MKPARVGNAIVDGVAIGPEQERIAIEVNLHGTTSFEASANALRRSLQATRALYS